MDKINHSIWEASFKDDKTLANNDVEDNRLKNSLLFSGRKLNNSYKEKDLINL